MSTRRGSARGVVPDSDVQDLCTPAGDWRSGPHVDGFAETAPCVQVEPGAAGNSSCYDTATLLKVLVPLAAVAPANPTLPLVISPLSTVLAAAAANGTELASAVRGLLALCLSYVVSVALLLVSMAVVLLELGLKQMTAPALCPGSDAINLRCRPPCSILAFLLQDLLTALQLSTAVDIGSFDALQGASEGSPQVHSAVRLAPQHQSSATRILHNV